jgi:antitoxin component YwqK of YwqJK toxin-antitoxin module
VDGHSHGMAIHYYHKGTKKYETPYVDGHPHGADIWYNEDGSKRLVVIYKNGKKISRKEF